MRIFTQEEQQFIKEHQQEPPATLMLRAGRYTHLPLLELVQQIQARQKAAHKLPTWTSSLEVVFPTTLSVEQTSSETTAAYKASLVQGHTLADLTGGFGVDSFYFSKRFTKVLHVEQNQELSCIAAHNFSVLGAHNIQTCCSTAEAFLANLQEKPDVIYLDPARRGDRAERVHLLQDCEPAILNLLPQLLEKATAVLLKASPMLDIALAIEQLGLVTKVWVLSVQNECKEVLYLISKDAAVPVLFTTVNLLPAGQQEFVFTQEQEQLATITYADPKAFIYEPNTAILKAGPFKFLAQQLHVEKLHPNSHLYTSQELYPDFPGRSFRCVSVSRYSKKELLARLPQKKANITVRNFPETVAEIRKKTGIREGGNHYLFFTTDRHQKNIVLICEKV